MRSAGRASHRVCKTHCRVDLHRDLVLHALVHLDIADVTPLDPVDASQVRSKPGAEAGWYVQAVSLLDELSFDQDPLRVVELPDPVRRDHVLISPEIAAPSLEEVAD